MTVETSPLELVLGRLSGTKKAGNEWVALCPVHGESHPSLSVAEGRKGVVFNCRSGGCSAEQIVAAIGLRMSDLFFDSAAPNPQAPVEVEKASADDLRQLASYLEEARRRLAAADGAKARAELLRRFGINDELIGELGLGYDPGSSVVSRPPFLKGFGYAARIIIPMLDGEGVARGVQGRAIGLAEDSGRLRRWAMAAGSGWSRVACFNLAAADPVIVCEGLSDPLAIAAAGYAAVGVRGATLASGALPDLIVALSGRQVVVVGDQDAAGEGFAREVSSGLARAGISVKVMTVPVEHGDVARWCETIGAEAFATALYTQVRLAVPVEVPIDDGAEDDPLDAPAYHPCTDLGNARRFVDAAGGDFRYVPEWGAWLHWVNGTWQRDIVGQSVVLAGQVAEDIALEPATESEAKALAKWSKSSQAAWAIDAALKLAKVQAGIPITVDQLDADPALLNLRNGMLDLSTGEFRAHDRNAHMMHASPVVYDPKATCPLWEAFIERILGGDEELIAFVQRAVGYSLTGYVNEQVMFFLWGTGSNGKSTFCGVLQSLLGSYAISAAPNLLVATGRDEHPTSIADLKGRRLVVSSETEQGQRMAEALVKQLTGSDKVKARFMRQDFFEFEPTHKLWLMANHKPQIRGTDIAIWRRIRLVPFIIHITDDEKDAGLSDKLRSELPGILNWAVRGLLQWTESGLGAAAAVTEATSAYRSENDDIGRFLDDCCVVGPECSITAAAVRERYEAWCREIGERPMSAKRMAGHLVDHGAVRTKNGYKRSVWLGVGLTDPDPSGPSDPSLGLSALRGPDSHRGNTEIGSDGSNGYDDVEQF